MSGKEEFTSKRLIRLPVNDVADCVLVLKKSQTIHIFGDVSLRKLAGSLSLYGHNLDDGNWHSVCSCGPHLITLECNSSWQHISLFSLLEEIDNEKNKLAIKKFTKNPKDIGCILLLKSLRLSTKLQCEDLFHLSAILDISSFDRRQKVLHEKTSDLHFTVFLDVPAPLSPLIMSPEWQSIPSFIQSQSADKGSSSSVILICGGKGVGKSTFARYMINKLLNTQRPLYFLDTDVGQSEFTPPGVLSLNKIDTPVFGPPFSHLSRPEKACFFGDVSPKDRPSSYIRLINVLYQYYKEFYSGTPLIVNTHGWVKGMGVRILLNIIGIVQPTHIIQINSKSQPTKNLPELNKEFLQNESGWNYRINEERDTSEEDWGCSSHIYQMDAFEYTTEGIKGVNLQASELRSLSLLSYFGSSQNPSSIGSIPDHILNHCAVYSQSISNLKLFNVSEDVPPSQMLYSMNASVVGLVKLDTNMVYSSDSMAMDSRLSDDVLFGEYLGLGIVRNIDPANGVLFIITPEPLHNICKVNALVKGKLEIPDCLLKKRKCENLPYLTSEFTYNHKGSGQKRVRYNLLRQKSRSPHSTDKKP